jgi:hypothetical protein
MTNAQTREKRLRRMADRRGLTLHKCPRRDPGALGYGTYELKFTAPDDEYTHMCDLWFALRREPTPNGQPPGPDWVALNKHGRRPTYGLTLDQIETELARLDHSDDAPPWI